MKQFLYKIFLVVFHIGFMKNIFRLIVGMQFGSNNSLKNTKQFIFVSNHNSHLDSPTMYSSIPMNRIFNVNSAAAHDFYGKNAILRTIAWIYNSRFIYRKRTPGAPKTLEVMESILHSGNSIMAFPEGTRGKPGVVAKFKTGIGILMKRNPQVPFIPAYIYGVEESMPNGAKFFIPYNCYINIGEPCYINEDMKVDEILDYMKEEIFKLKREE